MSAVSALLRRLFARPAVLRDQSGASAIEFGIFAPILIFTLLTTVDVGLAVHERMEMDNALRAGAEAAMSDLGVAKVREVVKTVAQDHFAIAGSDTGTGNFTLTSSSPLSVRVERFCACPESRSSKVGCSGSSSCDDAAKPYVYYRLEADKQYQAVLLPSLSLDSAVQVQAR